MAKRAIVLGGGGARGPYQVGVWRALRELGIRYSIVTGTSVGALNGALMVQGDYALAVRLWERLTIGDVVAGIPEGGDQSDRQRDRQRELLRQAVGQRGLDVSPLADVLRANIDEEKIRRSPIEYGLVSAKLPTFQPLEVVKAEIPEGELVDYMLASATWFPFFKAKRIGGEEYVDGAFTDNLPAELAVRCGAEEIVAVDLEGRGIVRMFKEPIPVTHIRSHWDLGDMMAFDTERAKRNIRLGYLDGLKAYRKLEGNAYAFHPGESRRNAAMLLPAIDRVRLGSGVSLFRNRERLRRVQSMLAHGGESRFLPRGEERASFGLAVTTAAEITAELLGIPPDKTYTMLELNRRILEAARQRGLGAESPPSGPGRRTALPRLCEALRAGLRSGGVPRAFWRTAALFPAEFVAANYVVILETR